MAGEGFLSRWARRKSQHREQGPVGPPREPPPPADASAGNPAQAAHPLPGTDRASTAAPSESTEARPESAPAELPPLESLTPESDFRPFMQAGVDAESRNAALKRLFEDPHFNRMDGLDIYIDDYGKPDPIPPAMLRMLNQARSLRLFDEDESGRQGAGPAQAPGPTSDPASGTAAAHVDETASGPVPGPAPEGASGPVPEPAPQRTSGPASADAPEQALRHAGAAEAPLTRGSTGPAYPSAQ